MDSRACLFDLIPTGGRTHKVTLCSHCSRSRKLLPPEKQVVLPKNPAILRRVAKTNSSATSSLDRSIGPPLRLASARRYEDPCTQCLCQPRVSLCGYEDFLDPGLHINLSSTLFPHGIYTCSPHQKCFSWLIWRLTSIRAKQHTRDIQVLVLLVPHLQAVQGNLSKRFPPYRAPLRCRSGAQPDHSRWAGRHRQRTDSRG